MIFMKKSPFLLDIIIIILLFISSFSLGFYYLKTHQQRPIFYEFHFEPAVLLTCGKSFGRMESGITPALHDFLYKKKLYFSCDELPATTKINTDVAIHAWYYFIKAVSLLWKITGISWPAVDLLFAFFFAIVTIMSYGIYRLAMPPILGLIGAVIFASLPAHLQHLISFRDYAKAPFLLSAFFILGLLVSKQLANKYKIILVILLGMIVGVGFGFRPDLLIIIPAAIMTLLFFIVSSIFNRLFLLFLFMLSFVITALPIFLTYRNPDIGSCFWHFPLLGLSSQFMQALNNTPSVYHWIYQFSDEFIYSTVNGFGRHVLHLSNIQPCNHQYDQASAYLFFQYVTHFPGDFILRCYSAILKILTIPGLVLTTLWICLVYFYRRRLAIFLICFLLYFFAYPVIQFLPKHYFHLYSLFWLPVGFFIQLILYCLFTAEGKQRLDNCSTRWLNSLLRKSVILISCVSMLLCVPLFAARLYQTDAVKKLIVHYLQAPVRKIPYEIYVNKELQTTLYKFSWPPNLRMSSEKDQVVAKIIRLTLGGKQCKTPSLLYTLEYETNEPAYFFRMNMIASGHELQQGNYYVFLPIYFVFGDPSPLGIDPRPQTKPIYSRPLGISLPSPQANCIVDIAEIINPDTSPWLNLFLPRSWHEQNLYQVST